MFPKNKKPTIGQCIESLCATAERLPKDERLEALVAIGKQANFLMTKRATVAKELAWNLLTLDEQSQLIRSAESEVL